MPQSSTHKTFYTQTNTYNHMYSLQNIQQCRQFCCTYIYSFAIDFSQKPYTNVVFFVKTSLYTFTLKYII